MLEVTIKHNDSLIFGDRFSLNFQRTLRIPDDDKTYPLPPGLGTFPICKVDDYKNRVPESWLEHGGVFIPMYQREALWIYFESRYWKPNAVKVGIGKVNAVSGKSWSQGLIFGDDDYLVCPPQPWLDGINAGDGYIRQFVAMPLGMGYTVEAQVTGEERFGGIQIIVYEPKPGKFPDSDWAPEERSRGITMMAACAGGTEMGLGAGGKMKQKIYRDPHEINTWDENNYGRVYVHIVNSMMYREITGKEPPVTPITAKTYAHYGFPWFDLYDETMSDRPASKILGQVKTVKEMDKEKGFIPQQNDDSIAIADTQIKKLQPPINPDGVRDGNW
jgi:hypothetical protein